MKAPGAPRRSIRGDMMLRKFFGLLIVLGGGWLAWAIWSALPHRVGEGVILAGTGDAATCKEPAIAYRAMQLLVLQQVPSPRSAQFPPQDTVMMRPGERECSYIYTTHLDTRDTFGGLTRTEFTAAIGYDGAQGKWRLDRFEQRRQ